jgi:triosephosphate isomerase
MIIAANWKAYIEQPAKAKSLVAAALRLASMGEHRIILAPAAPHLGMFLPGRKEKIAFAAQDISDSTGGAATGEITAATLAQLGVTYAILGHSERRARGETNEEVFSKLQHALAHGLKPIVCIGEHERDDEAQYLTFLRTQLESIFVRLQPMERTQVILAYEPIWAIGKRAADSIQPQDLQEMVLYIRKVLADFVPGNAAEQVPVLYGGSVEPGNIRMLAAGGQVDGFLIGHASVELASFRALVRALS